MEPSSVGIVKINSRFATQRLASGGLWKYSEVSSQYREEIVRSGGTGSEFPGR